MKLIITIILLLSCTAAIAQTDRQHIRQGNKLFRQQKFDKAETDYRKAVDKNDRNALAVYNLGCALMQQGQDSATVVQFENAAKLETNKLRKSQSFHNIGVICQGHQLFSEAIEAYKESLRLNPSDNETRYNLALCMRQQKKQEQNQQDKQDKKDKDEQGNDKKQEEQQKQEQDKNQQQQQPKQEQMSKENAEQLLQAVMQNEKNTQQKMQERQQQAGKRRVEKNW